MAYNASNLVKLTDGPQRLWRYTTSDPIQDVIRAGYFVESRLSLMDIIQVVSAETSKALATIYISSIASGVATAGFFKLGGGGGAVTVPSNTTAPSASGTGNYNQPITFNVGTWTNAPTSYTYQITRNGTPISGATGTITSTTFTYNPVSADVQQQIGCTVVATNTAGSSSAVASSNTIKGLALAPDAISNLAVASTTSSSAILTWSRPNGNGRLPVDYVVQFKLSSDSIWSTFNDGVSNATGATVTGLTYASSYDFRVTSTNDNGSGDGGTSPASNLATSSTQAIAPSAVSNLAAAPGNDGVSINLTWTLPNANGSSLSSQTIEVSANGTSGWSPLTPALSGTATSASVTGLTNATQYYFRHSSTNGIGPSATSNVANATTVAPPAAVTTLAAGTPTYNSVPLTWSAPANNGSPITDYVVQYKASTSSTWLTFADGTSSATGVTVTGLLATTSYDFRVAAVNGAGAGPASNVATTSTIAPFTSDANTFWWDFSSAPDILTNTAGTQTIAFVRERIGNKSPLVQTIKDLQPLKVAAGADFNQATPRRMQMLDVTGITNGTLGWYYATNYKPTTPNDVLFNIGRNASAIASRGSIEFSSSRLPTLKLGNAEASSISAIAAAVAQTLGVAFTWEILLDTVNDTVSMWINGVLQTLTGTVPSMPTFPATDPIAVTVGNGITSGAVQSADGSQQQAVFQNGIPSTGARSSISSFLNSIRQA